MGTDYDDDGLLNEQRGASADPSRLDILPDAVSAGLAPARAPGATARVGFLGMYRDPETSKPIEYYAKLPEATANTTAFVIDPMFATAGSAIAAVDMLHARGFSKVVMICMVSCPEGIKRFEAAHPFVPIYTAAVDDHLNEHNYIVPGLGDAGDRIFGTK